MAGAAAVVVRHSAAARALAVPLAAVALGMGAARAPAPVLAGHGITALGLAPLGGAAQVMAAALFLAVAAADAWWFQLH